MYACMYILFLTINDFIKMKQLPDYPYPTWGTVHYFEAPVCVHV